MKKICFTINPMCLIFLSFACISSYADTTAIPENIRNGIAAEALKRAFAGDEAVKAQWTERQYAAYLNVEKVKTQSGIPIERTFEIIAAAKEAHAGDWEEMFMYVVEESDAWLKLFGLLKSNPAKGEVIEKVWTILDIKRYALRLKTYEQWGSFPPVVGKGLLDQKTFDIVCEKAVRESGGDASKARALFRTNFLSRERFEQYSLPRVSAARMKAKKEEIEKEFPNDFERQYEELRKLDEAAFVNAITFKFDLHKITFIRSIDEKNTTVGMLVKINGRPAILCDKNFIPDKIPGSIKNRAGEVTYSAVISSKKHKLAALLVDSLPESFGDIPFLDVSEELRPGQPLRLIIFSAFGIFEHEVSFGSSDTSGEFSVISSGNLFIDIINRSVYNSPYDVADVGLGRAFCITKAQSPTTNIFLINPETGNIVAVSQEPTISSLTKADFSAILDRAVQATLERKAYLDAITRREDYTAKFIALKDLSDGAWEALDVKKFQASSEFLRAIGYTNIDVIELIQANFDFEKASRLNVFSAAVQQYKDTFYARVAKNVYEGAYRRYYIDLQRQVISRVRGANPSQFYLLNRDLATFHLNLNKHLYEYFSERNRAARDIRSVMSSSQRAQYENAK